MAGVYGVCVCRGECWMDIKEWTSLPTPELLTRASCRNDWERISAESSIMSIRWPSPSGDWTELNWTRWQCLPLCVILYIIQDGSVCLSVSYSTSYKMAVFASLYHTQHHTRWQCLPLCVILLIQGGSVCLSVSHSASYKMAVWIIMPLCATLNMAMSASLFHIEHHAKWQYLSLCVASTIIQDSFISLSLTSLDITLCGGLDAKHQLTNWLASLCQFQHHASIGCNLQASTLFCFALKLYIVKQIIFNFFKCTGFKILCF